MDPARPSTGIPDDDGDDHEAPDLVVTGEVVEWRGPAPFHFVVVTGEDAHWLTGIMREVTYGWGMIPVRGGVGDTGFTTSLWPRQGTFYVPVKDAVRRAEHIELGDRITVALWIRAAAGTPGAARTAPGSRG